MYKTVKFDATRLDPIDLMDLQLFAMQIVNRGTVQIQVDGERKILVVTTQVDELDLGDVSMV